MGDNSSIEWTDATWNPVRGCGPVWTGKVRLVPELLEQPLEWRRPRRIFVNSMSDLFHEDVPVDFIYRLWCVMAAARRHRFQILTKRAARMREVLTAPPFAGQVVVDNVWLGVSVEDQAAADERIPQLLATPAAVRWISAEPLLGPLDIERWTWPLCWHWAAGYKSPEAALAAGAYAVRKRQGLLGAHVPLISWVVAGGESGPGARPMHPDWARALRNHCAAAGVPFFFKQWGNWTPCLDHGGHLASDREVLFGDQWMLQVGKKSAGRELDGRTHDEYPA
jgi:protein gp37